MSDVFVSYKAEDRSRVQRLVDALESDGLSVWWDARVGGGDAWRETIAEQLDSAPCVIVVWSKRSTAPEGRFVRDEAARAQKRGAYLPVTIDKVDPPSQSFDRPSGDVLAIQSDIATNVARALSVELGDAASTTRSLGGTKNAQAQDLLLRARAAGGDNTEKGALATIALLGRAIELDPNYAEAYARRAQYFEIWASEYAGNVKEKERGQAQATASAQRAIAIAPEMSLGYAALGGIHQDQLEMRRSLNYFQRAGALPGPDVFALINYADVLSQARMQSEALSAIQRAIDLDPLNPLSREFQSLILFYGRQYAQSIEAARRALTMAPDRVRSRGFLGNSLLMLHRNDEALSEFQKMPVDDYRRLVGQAAIAAHAGKRDDALAAIPAIERRYGDAAFYQYVQIYAQVGLVSEGIGALETAWAKRDPGLAGIQVDPFIDPLRKDARVSAITASVFG